MTIEQLTSDPSFRKLSTTEKSKRIKQVQLENSDVEQCVTCKKTIALEEYIVNWGYCDECFDKGYNEYLQQTKGKQ